MVDGFRQCSGARGQPAAAAGGRRQAAGGGGQGGHCQRGGGVLGSSHCGPSRQGGALFSSWTCGSRPASRQSVLAAQIRFAELKMQLLNASKLRLPPIGRGTVWRSAERCFGNTCRHLARCASCSILISVILQTSPLSATLPCRSQPCLLCRRSAAACCALGAAGRPQGHTPHLQPRRGGQGGSPPPPPRSSGGGNANGGSGGDCAHAAPAASDRSSTPRRTGRRRGTAGCRSPWSTSSRLKSAKSG